jgi:hypothetical protein
MLPTDFIVDLVVHFCCKFYFLHNAVKLLVLIRTVTFSFSIIHRSQLEYASVV